MTSSEAYDSQEYISKCIWPHPCLGSMLIYDDSHIGPFKTLEEATIICNEKLKTGLNTGTDLGFIYPIQVKVLHKGKTVWFRNNYLDNKPSELK
jgi:hypothetical protein